MQIDILTLFPEMFAGPLDWSIVKRAKKKGLVEIKVHNLRNWATDAYKSVDGRSYGGGPGMVMRVDVIDRAVEELRNEKTRIVLLDAGGEPFTQKKAEALASVEHLIFICGHYEGVDHRVHERIAHEVISVGPYVLSGGEIPTMLIVDSVVRLLPGALGNEVSLVEESHGVLETEYPQYTRPDEYKGWKVPEVLMSGHHKKIETFRKSNDQSLLTK
jgi:tRNA (guanine37-N1)-methyltransferase